MGNDKTMENFKNGIDVKPVSKKKDYMKWTSKSSYMSQKIFDNDLVAIHKSKVTLTLNKPAYIGKYNLELNKLLMYKFHYDYIKNKYAINSRLLFSETDSLMYEIKTEDVYQDFSKHKEIFDFSNYSAESKCHNNSNKLVAGKMKDETGGVTSKGLV